MESDIVDSVYVAQAAEFVEKMDKGYDSYIAQGLRLKMSVGVVNRCWGLMSCIRFVICHFLFHLSLFPFSTFLLKYIF